MTGAGNHRFGKKPHNYKGGRYKMGDGYVLVHVPDHPFGGVKHRVMEHRLVLEAHLREHDPESRYLVEVDGVTYLRREIEVHHMNGVKDDNRLENLQPMTKSEHAKHHDNLAQANAVRLAKRRSA